MPTTTWNEIKNRSMTPAQQKRASRRAQKEIAVIELRVLREAQKVTQVQMAKRLKISQVAVSRLERRSNVGMTTLALYLRALGGRLEVRVILPDRDVVLSHVSK